MLVHKINEITITFIMGSLKCICKYSDEEKVIYSTETQQPLTEMHGTAGI